MVPRKNGAGVVHIHSLKIFISGKSFQSEAKVSPAFWWAAVLAKHNGADGPICQLFFCGRHDSRTPTPHRVCHWRAGTTTKLSSVDVEHGGGVGFGVLARLLNGPDDKPSQKLGQIRCGVGRAYAMLTNLPGIQSRNQLEPLLVQCPTGLAMMSECRGRLMQA